MYTVMRTGYINAYQNAMDLSPKYKEKKKETVDAGKDGSISFLTDEAEKEDDSLTLQEQEKQAEEKKPFSTEEEDSQLKTMEEFIRRMREATASIKNTRNGSGKTNLYDATMDLTLIANAEKEPLLRSIYARLLFKSKMIRTSGADNDQIRIALRKIGKVIGKTKGKIKKLQKEELIEKKRKIAEAEKRRKMAEELQRELDRKKKIRKNRERQDIEESKMGMGANYGGNSSDVSPAPSVNTGSGAAVSGSADILSQVDSVDMSPISAPAEYVSGAVPVEASVGSAVDVFL